MQNPEKGYFKNKSGQAAPVKKKKRIMVMMSRKSCEDEDSAVALIKNLKRGDTFAE